MANSVEEEKSNTANGSNIKVYVGSYGHSESEATPLVTIEDGLIGVNEEDGKIVFLDIKSNLDEIKSKYNVKNESIYKLGKNELLLPGFIDTHIHAAQSLGAGLGSIGHEHELRNTIKNFNVNSELDFKDPLLMRACYTDIVTSTLQCGTTTANYQVSSSTKESSNILAEVCNEIGQRSLVGRLDTTMNSEADALQKSLAETEEFIKGLLEKEKNMAKPIIPTPKSLETFCDEGALVSGLSELGKKYDINIQSNLSEKSDENDRVKELFPAGCKSTLELYEKFGLLTSKSIMTHCLHLTEDEMEVLKKYSTSVSHCPTSNILHENGYCPVKKLKGYGIRVGLGTNASRHFSTSMLQSMRHAILTSKIIRDELSFEDVFHLGTLGGAEALSIEAITGNFAVGKHFDAIVINVSEFRTIFKTLSIRERIEKFIKIGDKKNIKKVIVNGRVVSEDWKKKKSCRFL